jgi:hypothetical protein
MQEISACMESAVSSSDQDICSGQSEGSDKTKGLDTPLQALVCLPILWIVDLFLLALLEHLLCITAGLRAALSSALGKAVDAVTNADVALFSIQAAASRTQEVVKDCIAAVTDENAAESVQKTERTKCRSTVVKETLAVALCKPVADVSDEEVFEMKKAGSARLSSETMRACVAGAGADSIARASCQTVARDAVAEVAGSEGGITITDLQFERFKQSGAQEQVFTRALACSDAEAECDLRDAINSATGGSADSTDSTASAKTETKGVAKRAAAAMIAQNLMACAGSKSTTTGEARTAAELMDCTKSSSNQSLAIMVDPKQFVDVVSSAIASVAIGRMEGCRVSSKTVDVCKTEIQAMPIIAQLAALASSDTPSNDTRMPPVKVQDLMLRGRAEIIRSASECSDAQQEACLNAVREESIAAGGLARSERSEIGFNAKMQAAEVWAGCNNTGSVEAECEALAKESFERNQGNTNEWPTTKSTTKTLAEGINSGTPTEVCAGLIRVA